MAFELEYIACDLCGSDDTAVRYRKPDTWLWLNKFQYPVVECRRCGLVYVNPRPTFKDNARYYPAGYHDGRDSSEHESRYIRQLELLGGKAAGRVLDVGCARGDWLSFLGAHFPGLEMHGVDAFSGGVSNPAITFYGMPLDACQLPVDYFDLVTAWAVFEHLHYPRAYFEVVARALKPGGRFVFLVTNSESCYGRYAYGEDVPRHLYHFNPRTLEAYARHAGMKVHSIRYDDTVWDGRGFGTFKFLLGRIAGITWDDLERGSLPFPKKLMHRLGAAIDLLVFTPHWEARLRRSGVMVVTMEK